MRVRQRIAVPAFGAHGFQLRTHAVFPAAVLPVEGAIGSGLAGGHMIGTALSGLPVSPFAVQGGHRSGRNIGARALEPHRYRLGAGAEPDWTLTSENAFSSNQPRHEWSSTATTTDGWPRRRRDKGTLPLMCERKSQPSPLFLWCAPVVRSSCKQQGHRKQACPN